MRSQTAKIFISLIVLFITHFAMAEKSIAVGQSSDTVSDELKADWLFQADNKPTAELILKEIGWARGIANRIKQKDNAADFSKDLELLADIEKVVSKVKAENDIRDWYFAVREIKRKIMFSDPAVDFDKVLLIETPYPIHPDYGKWDDAPSLEWGHEARHRNGFMAPTGGKLLVLEGLRPGSPVRDLMAGKEGAFWRPDLSFDGKRVLFCFKPDGEKSFHLYEMNVDGTNCKQLTFGDYDDLDPIYLPDGKIMFSTMRGNTFIRCMPQTHAFQLARCDADGKNIYIVSRNSECDYTPSVTNEGQVIYSRWEYTDKALWRVQSLWSCNPDGTKVNVFWGNQSIWPDMLVEARQIPNSDRFMFAGVGHHAWFDGSIGIIDPKAGLNFPKGLTRVTGEVPWPECGQGPEDTLEKADYHASGDFYAYKTPCPLSEEVFLVSARTGKRVYSGSHNNWFFGLYLMDVYGNKELIYKGTNNAIHAIPFKPRELPQIIPDMVEWPEIGVGAKPVDGMLFSNNVFENAPDIPRDKVKYLRIVEMDHKTYTTWRKAAQHDGPSVSVTQAEAVKRFLGTVPVAKDGSVCFKLPPGKAVYFQLVDENYQCIKTMRSFTGVMPGEIRGCVGCHEGQNNAPSKLDKRSNTPLAMRKKDLSIQPEPWGQETFSYTRFVQPLLDKHCGQCHQGDGKAVDKLDLTFRPSNIGWRTRVGCRPDEESPFYEPYLTLVSKGTGVPWGQPGRKVSEKGAIVDNIAGVLIVESYGINDPGSLKTLPAMSVFSPVSQLVYNASSGKHHNVKMSKSEVRRLSAWVDANGPYLGREEIREMYDPFIWGAEEYLPVQPRVGTAPDINRFDLRQDGNSYLVAGVPLRHYKPEPWPKGEKPEIVKAIYGANKDIIDVTGKIRDLNKKEALFTLRNYNNLFGDPINGTVKQLTITYKGNGITKEIQFPENANIALPYPQTPKDKKNMNDEGKKMTIAIGADPWGAELKDVVLAHLIAKGYTIIDLDKMVSPEKNYYDIACQGAKVIQDGKAQRAFLFCGTGMGMAIVANKHNGVIASVVETPFAAKMARAVNNANVLTMGKMTVEPDQAVLAVDEFLSTSLSDTLEEHKEFLNEAVRKVNAIDDSNRKNSGK
ncbi:MAG: RpiB/LacA/LacB family sugar-phosphate isomerase [Phycisphaerae bacterium]|nr:RpiB/LacA/LacB family sugar-phosphate isomerase [Phycisphaerae bacterium]